MCIHFPDRLPICGCPDCRVCIDRELPLPAPANPFSAARAARWHGLLAAQRTLAVALEASLSRKPILFAEGLP
ncbi:hypothetical protein [Bradyrhizobium sp. BR 10261]|uniref:hypothetical protein n=1 Tax=Bradyrhizobium sp. BR 10261 TaxID=2749992 RepID=UPI001C64E756|nr:hypothetical protein [Bradyrhizobium sp. BR 10261]MBW7966769.1 hypothetical protein [Bradyrhizobium sp. BR 10261]